MSVEGVSKTTAAFWLILWTLNNIGVTLINKAAFATVEFPYPYALSAIHMAFCMLGSHFIFWALDRSISVSKSKNAMDDTSAIIMNATIGIGALWDQVALGIEKALGIPRIQRQQLDRHGNQLILIFSVLFSSNIAIGNVSLQHVSVNFNQVMRSLVPAFTMWIGMLALGKSVSMPRQRAVWPVVLGVAMACYGDRMSYTSIGFFYTFLCAFLAAVKVVASSEMLTGNCKLHPVDLLHRMAPLALIQCGILSFCTGEASEIIRRWNTDFSPSITWVPVLVLSLSGVLAFSLNICALQAYRMTSPLTCCIAAAVKQVLMIWMGTVMFGTPVTPLNGAGIMVVLVASARYSYVAVTEQLQKEAEEHKQKGSNKISSQDSTCSLTTYNTAESADLEIGSDEEKDQKDFVDTKEKPEDHVELLLSSTDSGRRQRR